MDEEQALLSSCYSFNPPLSISGGFPRVVPVSALLVQRIPDSVLELLLQGKNLSRYIIALEARLTRSWWPACFSHFGYVRMIPPRTVLEALGL